MRVRLLAALVAVVILAASGARLTDEQRAAALDGPGTATNVGAGAEGGGAVGPATTTAAGPAGGGVAEAATAQGSRSTGVDDPGPDGAVVPGTRECGPAPSTEVGVTDTEIRLGNISTVSGPIAGFGLTGVNGVQAYLAYANSQGGVCGRQLQLLRGDDRLDTGVNRSEARRLSGEVFGFVGGTTVVDAGLAGVLEGTDVVSAGLAISDPAIASGNVFSPNPIDPSGTTQGTAAMWAYFAATRGVTSVAIVYPAQADARTRALAYIPDIESAGLTVDGPYEVAITETNYVAVAQQIENHGADAVLTALELTGMARLAQAFDQIGYRPTVPFYGAQAYGQQFLERAGPAAEGTTLGLAYSIFEDAPTNPTVATFLDWYERVAPGSDPDFFAVMGWAAADMMVQALQAAGPAPTRAAVLAFLRDLHQFDAHGLLAANDPAGKRASPDFMVVTVTDGQWVREYPAGDGFGSGTAD